VGIPVLEALPVRQNKVCLYAHFVWATWDREPFITDAIEEDLYRFIQGTCHNHKCTVLAVGGMPDHVHLLVALSNMITVANLMEFVKGASSRFVTEKLLKDGWFKWQGSYGVFSVSP
jgi:REP element-mobilizing transposase RayT